MAKITRSRREEELAILAAARAQLERIRAERGRITTAERMAVLRDVLDELEQLRQSGRSRPEERKSK